MSQHLYKTDTHAVLMGYDRPLNGFFMVIEDRHEMVYSNLFDIELINCGGLCLDLNYFTQKALSFGIQIPKDMLKAIEQDACEKVGNKFIDHSEIFSDEESF